MNKNKNCCYSIILVFLKLVHHYIKLVKIPPPRPPEKITILPKLVLVQLLTLCLFYVTYAKQLLFFTVT